MLSTLPTEIKMRNKEKKKEETERERMERLNWEHNDIDWVGLYNSDKLSSLKVDKAILVLFPSQDHLQRLNLNIRPFLARG